MKIDNILNKKVSYQEHCYSTEIKEITVGSALDQIKGKELYSITNSLRNFYTKGDFTNYDKNKKNLSGVTFCGFFYPKRSGNNFNSSPGR